VRNIPKGCRSHLRRDGSPKSRKIKELEVKKTNNPTGYKTYKGRDFLVHAMNARSGSRGIAPLILNLGIR